MAFPTDNPPQDWPSLRRALDRFTATLARLTSDLEDVFVALDGEPASAAVVQLCFDEPASTPPTQHRPRNIPSRDDFANARLAWTFDDEVFLSRAVNLGVEMEWLSTKLGRTPKAIQRKIAKLNEEGRI